MESRRAWSGGRSRGPGERGHQVQVRGEAVRGGGQQGAWVQRAGAEMRRFQAQGLGWGQQASGWRGLGAHLLTRSLGVMAPFLLAVPWPLSHLGSQS